MDTTLRKGAIARCSKGHLGLITVDKPIQVTYAQGNCGIAWIGIHITDKEHFIGKPWSSRNPMVICNIEDLCDLKRTEDLIDAFSLAWKTIKDRMADFDDYVELDTIASARVGRSL